MLQSGGAENKMGNLGLWIVLEIPRSYVRTKNISTSSKQSHES